MTFDKEVAMSGWNAMSYDANTGGGAITIQNVTTGQYKVTFAGLGGPGGNAQVVAHGTDSTRCKVDSWFQSGSNELVNVLCPVAVNVGEEEQPVVSLYHETGEVDSTEAILHFPQIGHQRRQFFC
jgi:hypothetical protein